MAGRASALRVADRGLREGMLSGIDGPRTVSGAGGDGEIRRSMKKPTKTGNGRARLEDAADTRRRVKPPHSRRCSSASSTTPYVKRAQAEGYRAVPLQADRGRRPPQALEALASRVVDLGRGPRRLGARWRWHG